MAKFVFMRLKSILKRKRYTCVTLKKTKTGHFWLKVKINGVKGRFILDTGASNSCINIKNAGKFKMNFEDSETKAAGVGAVDIKTKISTKNKIKLGKWKHHSFNFVLIDLDYVNQALTEHNAKTVDGIIGADLLNTSKAIINYHTKNLFLKKQIYKF